MNKERKRMIMGIKTILALFTTFFIVLGVLLIGYAAFDTSIKVDENKENIDVNARATSSAFLILQKDKASIKFIDSDNTRDLIWPDDASRLGKPVSQIQGVQIDSGKRVWIEPGFVLAPQDLVRSPDGRRQAKLLPVREDGSSVIELSYGKEISNYTLRDSNKEFYKNIELIDWLNQYELIFLAGNESLKVICSLNVDGTIKEKAKVMDNTRLFTISDDGVCFVEEIKPDVHLGESMYKYNIWEAGNNTTTKILNDKDVEIQKMVGVDSGLVYVLADQKMFWQHGDKNEFLGRGIPLQVSYGKLIYRIEGRVYLLDLASKENFELKDVDYNSALFYLDNVILD